MTLRRSFISAIAPAAMVAAALGAATPAHASAEPYIGEIVPYGFDFCPRGWAAANGQLLAIAQNTALFSILGTTYGGDGRTTFALPNLQSRVAVGQGNSVFGNYSIGQTQGTESFTVTAANMPSHTHTAALRASNLVGNTNNPVDNSLARVSGVTAYSTVDPTANLNAGDVVVATAGSSTPVAKLSPALTMNYCIALVGLFPPRP